MPPDCEPILGSSLKCEKTLEKSWMQEKKRSHMQNMSHVCITHFSILRSTELEREIQNVIPQIRELLLSDWRVDTFL